MMHGGMPLIGNGDIAQSYGRVTQRSARHGRDTAQKIASHKQAIIPAATARRAAAERAKSEPLNGSSAKKGKIHLYIDPIVIML
jgi:hypothetical protein